MEIKKCSKCGETKGLDCFSKNSTKKDGLQNQCKTCNSVYGQINKETIAATKKAHHKANKERLNAISRDNHHKNKEERNATSRAYREENREIFVHYSKVEMDGFKILLPDLRVSFEIMPGKREGTVEASNVKIIPQEFKETK